MGSGLMFIVQNGIIFIFFEIRAQNCKISETHLLHNSKGDLPMFLFKPNKNQIVIHRTEKDGDW